MSATASATNLIGYTLEDRYRIVREIGRGGMGVVYEAEHTQLGKRVAIKLMLDKYADDGEAVARFRREALAASTIGNSHIIDVSHIGKAPDGRPFVVMELLIGMPLAQVIEMSGPMSPWRAIHIMRQVLRAVGAAHAKGIVHRDLKPDNIFLVEQDDQRDFVKLLDFGISKMMDGEAAIAHTKLTTTGMVMGTPLYMAPEQAMGAAIDHHADIYACGVILYEMLSGRPPFEGATYPVLIAKLLTAEPTPILERVPGLQPRLVQAVHRALEKDPARRWDSCDQFFSALPLPTTPSQIELAGTLGIGPEGSLPPHFPPGGVRAAGALSTARTAATGTRSPWMWILGAAAAGVLVASIAIIALTHGGGAPAAGPVAAASASGPTPAGTLAPGAAPGAAPAPGSAAASAPGAGPVVAPIVVTPVPVALGKLHVDTTPGGATVTVDGQPFGRAGDKLPLAAGKHKVHVELAGYAAQDATIDLAADETQGVTMTLFRAPAARAGGGPVHVIAPPPPVVHHTLPPVTTPPTANNPPVITSPPLPPPPVHDTPSRDPGTKPNPYSKPNPYGT